VDGLQLQIDVSGVFSARRDGADVASQRDPGGAVQ